MTHDEAFLAAIREQPDDDGPRLIYADWLDDHGQADRAEFIRVQCERARGGQEPARAVALQRRALELLQAHWEEWVGPLREATRPASARFGEQWMAGGFRAEAIACFRRGFVDHLMMGVEEFLARTADLAPLVPLRHLVLYGPGCRAAGLAAAPYLNWVQTLSFIDYFVSPLTAAGARALAGSPHLGRLRALHLHRNDIGDAGSQALAAAPWLRGLHALNLADNGLSPAGVRALVESAGVEHLQALWLGRNHLGDEGAEALARSPHLAGLLFLYLEANGITDRGARALADSPYLGRLQTLLLAGNDISAVSHIAGG